MISNMRMVRSIGSAVVFVGLALVVIAATTEARQAATPAQTQTAGPAIRLTASSANVAQPGESVKINIIRWSTDEERNALVSAMSAPPARGAGPRADVTDPFGTFRGGGDPPPARGGARGDADAPAPKATAPFDPIVALTEAIGKATTVGYLWTNEVTGYPVKYAYRATMPDGTERIILATDRRLGAFSAAWKPVAPSTPADYKFTLIDMRVGPKAPGEGKTSLNTKVIIDAEAKTIALDNYAATPAILKNVRR